MARRLTALLILGVALAHLFVAGRALWNLDWFIAVAIEKARPAGDPVTAWRHWRLMAIIASSWLTAVGGTAGLCGLGMLRESNVARRIWIAASFLIVPLYSLALARYVHFGLFRCAIAAGLVAAVALGSSCYLLTTPGWRSFATGEAGAT